MTSYAYSNRAGLPGRASNLDTSELSKTHADARAHKQPSGCSSSMVEADKPQPQPRPSPDIAHEVDRVAFDQRWKDEQARAERKAAFIRERTDPDTGGHIRVFNRKATLTR